MELVVVYTLTMKKTAMGKHYSQQEMQMANKQMKKCSSLLIIKKEINFAYRRGKNIWGHMIGGRAGQQAVVLLMGL